MHVGFIEARPCMCTGLLSACTSMHAYMVVQAVVLLHACSTAAWMQSMTSSHASGKFAALSGGQY